MRFGAQYSPHIEGIGNVTLAAQARYRSRMALAVDNTLIVYANFADPGTGTKIPVEGLFQDPYWLLDAHVVWQATHRLAVGLYGYNLTNKAYKTDAQEFSSVGNIRTVYYGAPRTVTLRLTLRY
jgi:iron complex outermembrane receptor protein